MGREVHPAVTAGLHVIVGSPAGNTSETCYRQTNLQKPLGSILICSKAVDLSKNVKLLKGYGFQLSEVKRNV